VSLGITLLKKRKPSLLRMGTLGKVEGAAVGLKDAAVGLVWVDSLDVIKEDPVEIALVVVRLDQIEKIVNNLRDPFAVAVKDETIYTNVLIVSNTKPLNHTWLLTKGTKSSDEPTISVATLSDVIGSRAIDIEARFVENVADTLDTFGREVFTGDVILYIGKGPKTVFLAPFEVLLDVKVRVAVLFVDAATLLDNFFYLCAACRRSIFIRSLTSRCGNLVTSLGGKLCVCV
jgi:hypothetical protein